MHSSYWSCSKFADWLRGTAKPKAATMDEWDEWHETAKKSHSFRYWFVEDFMSGLQTVVEWPMTKIKDIRYYINNRWVTRTHALTSALKRGQWHEFEERLLYCMFDELANYVEIECAWHHVCWDEKARKQYQTPWYRRGLPRLRIWRCPEAGIAHLEWEISLTMDEGYGVMPGNPDYGKPTHQSIAAQETLELYNWWRHERPQRRDPYEAAEINDHFNSKNKPTAQARQISMEILTTLERKYEREDEVMMIRLIKLRRNLWT